MSGASTDTPVSTPPNRRRSVGSAASGKSGVSMGCSLRVDSWSAPLGYAVGAITICHSPLWTQVVVDDAEQAPVVEVGRPAVGPGEDVVRFAPGRWPVTAGPDAAAVAVAEPDPGVARPGELSAAMRHMCSAWRLTHRRRAPAGPPHNARPPTIGKALLSGVPSTTHAVLSSRNPLPAALAAGSLALPRTERRSALLIAGALVLAAVSLGWAVVLVPVLPPRPSMFAGATAGAAAAALDLGVIGRRFPRIRELPMAPQVADHVAYGVIVAVVLRRRYRMGVGSCSCCLWTSNASARRSTRASLRLRPCWRPSAARAGCHDAPR